MSTIELGGGPAEAAQFIAELVRQGVTFTARTRGEWFVITLTGGF